MNAIKIFIVLISLFLISCTQQKEKVITDLIKPLNLNEGMPTKVMLSDLFYAESYDIKFLPNDNFEVLVNDTLESIEINPKKDFCGLDLISFKLNEQTFELPVKLIQRKKYSFSYKPKGNPKTVNLFGQFNGWNRENLPMKDEDNDGVYNITIPLDPGRYEYKFFVDGAELTDPQNPVKLPNGLGDFNSVIVIENPASYNNYLHLLKFTEDENYFSYNFYYESGTRELISINGIVALIENFRISPDDIRIDDNKITLSINKDDLQGLHVLRIAVSNNGSSTNFQTIKLKNGFPTDDNNSWNDAIIYSIMIDRFSDGDSTNNNPVIHPDLSAKANYNGGDLQGIIYKLEEGYFDSVGINTIWISPVVDNTNKAYKEYPPPHRYYTGYHGYWPISDTGVEEHFGDMALLKNLVASAHKYNIKVLLDYVSHHVHEEHPFWKEHPDWFGKLELPDGRKNLRLFDEHRLTTWFEPYIPSFDFVSSREALDTMTDNAVWWLKETGADGFRHDAVKHVPNEFWRTLTKKIKYTFIDKDVYQVGETFGGIDLISSYVTNGQLSAQFDFNLFDVALPVFLYPENSFELLDLQMQKTFSVYGFSHLMANIMDSHDKIRYMAYADGDLELNSNLASELGWTNPPKVDHPSSYKKLQLYLAYILTIPGIPVIYYGDEIGMTGASDPDNRRMMHFSDDLSLYEKDNFKIISKLTRIRKDHSALRQGDFLTLLADENCYAYLRSDMSERILVVLNKSEEDQNIMLNLPAMYNLTQASDLSNGILNTINENKLLLDVPAIGWQIFELN